MERAKERGLQSPPAHHEGTRTKAPTRPATPHWPESNGRCPSHAFARAVFACCRPRKPIANIFQRKKDGRIPHKPGTTVPRPESADDTPRSAYRSCRIVSVSPVKPAGMSALLVQDSL